MGLILPGTVESGIILQKTTKMTLVLALLCMAFFVMEPVAVKSNLYKVFREVSKYQMLWQTRSWEHMQGSHFIVRYQPQDGEMAQMVLEAAERSYEPVSGRFGYRYEGKALVVVYPDKESLGRSFGWEADESAMGVYWAGVIRVLSPRVWIKETDPDRIAEVFEAEGPMAHELTHLVVDYLTAGNYTRWFTEGIAQYQEAIITGYQLEHRPIGHPEELYPLASMDRDFDRLPDQSLAYFQSLQAVNYLVSRYGEEGLRGIIDGLGRGLTLEESFQDELGISMTQFESSYQKWAVQAI